MSEHIPINGRANKTKSAFRMEYSAGINIKAKPDRVWALMTNAADFPRWNSTVKSMEGKIGLGEVVKLIVTLAPTRSFNLKVIEFVPENNKPGGRVATGLCLEQFVTISRAGRVTLHQGRVRCGR